MGGLICPNIVIYFFNKYQIFKSDINQTFDESSPWTFGRDVSYVGGVEESGGGGG